MADTGTPLTRKTIASQVRGENTGPTMRRVTELTRTTVRRRRPSIYTAHPPIARGAGTPTKTWAGLLLFCWRFPHR